MKTTNALIAFFLLLSVSLQSAPDISMEIYRFKTESGAYIEVTLYAVGTSLTCMGDANTEYGMEYVIMIKDQQSNIVAGNKYSLSAKGCPAKDIFDVKRFTLPAGNYVVEVEANDFADTLNQVVISQPVSILSTEKSSALSDLQLLSTIKSEPEEDSPLHKSGLYLEPLPFRLYYPALNQLCLYFETYHTEQLEGQPYLQYTISPIAGTMPPPVVTYKKVKKEPVSVNVFQLDISTLITGTYTLETALYDGNKQKVEARSIPFSRLNPIGDSIFMETATLDSELGFANSIPDDSLDYSLKAMAPIVNSIDNEVLSTILKKGSPKTKRFFVHRYWTTISGKDAGAAYTSYMKVAKAVDATYRSGFGYGFQTDRGHVFLKYGQPNDIMTVEDEPSAPPYEIWFYNSFPATHQTNVRFLFYNPSLGTNGFELLHSNARGEVNNARWEVELYKDATLETPAIDDTRMGDNVHRNARTYFEN